MNCKNSISATRRSTAGFGGTRVALLTQHGKERVIAPVLHSALGCFVELVTGYDTDLLGTFTRDIARAGTQLEAARKKARTGMDMSGLSLGLASEGAFGCDPMLGALPWNTELVLWMDAEQGYEVIGLAQGRAMFGHQVVTEWPQVEAFARQWGFPDHHIVARPEGDGDRRIRKGISNWQALEEAFVRIGEEASNGLVFLETDVRAFANPTRMEMIHRATEDLAAKLASTCPACGVPGFWITERVPGLPCGICGAPTAVARADVWGCVRCPHRLTREHQGATSADPARCDFCNP